MESAPELVSFDVSWSEFDPPEPEKYVRDPLGLQNFAEMLADEILPGITSRTTKLRYYSFLCWAVDLIEKEQTNAEGPDRDWNEIMEEKLLILEKLFVLSVVAHYSGKSNVPVSEKTLLGIDFAGAQFNPTLKLFDLGGAYRFLVNQRFQGCLGAYRTSLIDLGLIEDSNLRVTKIGPYCGRALATAFCKNKDIERIVSRALSVRQIGSEDLRKLGNVFSLSPSRIKPSEMKVLEDRIRKSSPIRAASFEYIKSSEYASDLSVVESSLSNSVDNQLGDKLRLIRVYEYFTLAIGKLFEIILGDLESGTPTVLTDDPNSVNVFEVVRLHESPSASICLLLMEKLSGELKSCLVPYVQSVERTDYTVEFLKLVIDVIEIVDSTDPRQTKLGRLIQKTEDRHKSIKKNWSWIYKDEITGKMTAIRPNIDFGLKHSYRINSLFSLRKEFEG